MGKNIMQRNRSGIMTIIVLSFVFFIAGIFIALFGSIDHLWITTSWKIDPHFSPLLYGLLFMVEYFWVPLIGLFIAFGVLRLLFFSGYTFIVVGVMLLIIPGYIVYAFFAKKDPFIAAATVGDYISYICIVLFFVILSIITFSAHFRIKNNKK